MSSIKHTEEVFKTWDEWKKLGRTVICGQKASWENGKPVFAERQTTETYYPKTRYAAKKEAMRKEKKADTVQEAYSTIAMVNTVGEEYEGQYDYERNILRDAGYDEGEIRRAYSYP